MSGNVWEFCQDLYGEYPEDAVTDPEGPDTGQFRTMRGGSIFNDRKFCRAAERQTVNPNSAIGTVGFRLVRSQD
ncbi:MAG: SUMF1/EgtB/PvdO family nonheme iron enzyme [Candidatus Hydrogenedentes bacterium]|nr:SUMF1/EgtB/PvdO family nonheme iron enzyme [Candidatus Hydrogenedentota bacterium]